MLKDRLEVDDSCTRLENTGGDVTRHRSYHFTAEVEGDVVGELLDTDAPLVDAQVGARGVGAEGDREDGGGVGAAAPRHRRHQRLRPAKRMLIAE